MELAVRIKNGALDLAASGVVLAYGDNPTRFSFYEDKTDEPPFDIVMKFVNDRSNPKRCDYIDKAIDGEENAVEIIFTNFNEAAGHRLNEPWLIGESFGRDLYLVYAISGSGDFHYDLKVIQYSFYLGKKVEYDSAK